MNEDIDEKTGFPKLDGGWCNGDGWLNVSCVCWCEEYLAMREEFQRVFNKAWDHRHANKGQDPDCINWEKAWRFGTSRWKEAEKRVRELREKGDS